SETSLTTRIITRAEVIIREAPVRFRSGAVVIALLLAAFALTAGLWATFARQEVLPVPIDAVLGGVAAVPLVHSAPSPEVELLDDARGDAQVEPAAKTKGRHRTGG